jgi:hypothetical protein
LLTAHPQPLIEPGLIGEDLVCFVAGLPGTGRVKASPASVGTERSLGVRPLQKSGIDKGPHVSWADFHERAVKSAPGAT